MYRFCLSVCVAWLCAASAAAQWVGKPLDATDNLIRIEHLKSGRVGTPAGLRQHCNPLFVAFDNLSNPSGDPNAPLNLAYLDSAGQRVCQQPLDPNQIFSTEFYLVPPESCPGALAFPEIGIVDPLTLHWDNYEMDPSVAGEPNALVDVRRIDFTFLVNPSAGATPNERYTLQATLLFYEAFDADNNGQLDWRDGVVVTFGFDPNEPQGLQVASLDLGALCDPCPFLVPTTGLMLLQFDSVFRDENGVLPLQDACAVGNVFSGGYLDDPTCPTPQDLVLVGSVDQLMGDYWYFANDTQGAQPGPPYDPNITLGSGDVLNDGLLVNLAFDDHARDRPLRLSIRQCTPGLACGRADASRDLQVDQADLMLLLGCLDNPGCPEFGTQTDMVDVLEMQRRFGVDCSCGCP